METLVANCMQLLASYLVLESSLVLALSFWMDILSYLVILTRHIKLLKLLKTITNRPCSASETPELQPGPDCLYLAPGPGLCCSSSSGYLWAVWFGAKWNILHH